MSINFPGTGGGAYISGWSFLPASPGPFTIAFFFKPAALSGGSGNIFTFYSGGTLQVGWDQYPDNAVAFGADYSGTNPNTDSGIVIADANWHHFAYRKAASGASEWAKFLDGTKTVINASIAFTLGPTNATGTTYIGTGGLAGRLAKFHVYDVALSDGELSTLAGGGSVDKGANWIVGWNMAYADALADSSGHGHALTGVWDGPAANADEPTGAPSGPTMPVFEHYYSLLKG